MFVDASAICAIALKEDDSPALLNALEQASFKLTSPLAVWESVTAVARRDQILPGQAHEIVTDLLEAIGIKRIAVPPEAGALAVEAFERYGKGRHPAALNFGDCFAYACARHFRVPLLYKGDDFRQTDIATVAIGD